HHCECDDYRASASNGSAAALTHDLYASYFFSERLTRLSSALKPMPFDIHVLQIFILTTLAFLITISWTPVLTNFLYRYRLGKQIRGEQKAPIFSTLHQSKIGTPTMGGVLIWGTT